VSRNGFARDSKNVDALEASLHAKMGKPVSAQATIEGTAFVSTISQPNCAFRNIGGLKFVEVGTSVGV